jgi:hypothetical protein
MTATLNSRTCTSVRAVLPRYGVWTAWATLATEEAVDATPGGAALVVAGLTLTGTVKRQGTRNGLRSVELEGGFGGWGRAVSTVGGGLALGNLVSLQTFAEKLAAAAGERVSLAAGVNRKLGPVVARLGAVDAGALLSQACAAPAGASVVPWWVAPDGTTQLGARTGAAATASAVDVDALGRAYVYAEDDATGLLPGCTIDGAPIVELVIEAGESVREIATVAVGDEDPETFWGLLRRFVLRVVGHHVSARTLYRYVVREVNGDGTINVRPVRSLLAPELDRLHVWPGIAGGRCEPKAGSEVLVQFADGDPVASAACIVAFAPAIAGTPSIPNRAELDGDEVVLASGDKPVGRGGATLQFGTGEVVGSVYVTLTDPDGNQQSWAFASSAGPLTVAPSGTPVISGTIGTIDPGRDEVKV